MTIEWSGRTSAYEHKFDNWKENSLTEGTNKAFRQVWILDAQYRTCPVEVEDVVRELWALYELGNDNYILKTDLESLEEGFEDLDVTPLIQYVKEQKPDIAQDETFWIHWWW